MRVPDTFGGASSSSGGGRIPTPEDFSPGPRPLLPHKVQPQSRGLEILVLVLLPWLVFSLIVALFVLAYQAFPLLVWALIGACALLGLLFIAMGGTRGGPMQLALGLLTIAAVAVAVPIGRFAESNYMADYWLLDSGAVYRRLDPLDPGASHTDATMIEFQEGTFVDVQRALGYMKAGTVYCVAPITRAGANQSQAPEYWAGGEDCCAQRGSFSCGDLDGGGARSGLAVSDGQGHYRTAVRMAQSTYEMHPAPWAGASPPLVLRWTADTGGYMDSLLKGGATFASAASAIYLVGSGCAGAVLAPRLR